MLFSKKTSLIILFLISVLFISCYESEDVPEAEIVDPSEFTQKLLIGDYTGTWCVNCTGAGHAIEKAVHDNDRFIPVAIHHSGSEVDPMENVFSVSLVNQYNPSKGFPQVNLNNQEKIWPNDYLTSTLESLLNKYAPVGLAISSTMTATDIDVTVSVGFVEETTAIDNYKLVVYLLEDGFVYPQHNGSLSDFPDIIEDYEHNDILRHSLTDVFGDVLPNQVASNHRYSKDFSIAIPSNVVDNSKLKIVAFVVDKNGLCLNVQLSDMGTIKNFD